jgi:hypothetical protein
VVGAERGRRPGQREYGWNREQDGERGEDQLRVPQEAEPEGEKGADQAEGCPVSL